MYVGIPSSSAFDRSVQLVNIAGKIIKETKSNVSGKPGRKRSKKIARALKSAFGNISNAQLLYIHSKGSPLRNIPARPVLEPAIEAKGNREGIAAELAKAVQASLHGNDEDVTRYLKRAGLSASNAAKRWFTDSRNNWAPNAPATIRAKGSDQPLIDTGALRQAITYVIKGEE